MFGIMSDRKKRREGETVTGKEEVMLPKTVQQES